MKQSYYDKIDKLQARFDAGDKFTLSEACWLIYAELGWASFYWVAWKEWAKKEKLTRKMIWPIWKNIFYGYLEMHHPAEYKRFNGNK